MKRFFLMFCLSLLLVSCASNSKSNKELTLPEIDPDTIGDVRIAIVGKNQLNNVILINQSNKKYLTPRQPEQKNRKNIPLTDLEYKSNILGFDSNTTIVIIEDIVMAKLLSLVQTYKFYKYSLACSNNDFTKHNWPDHDSIFLEQNNDWKILTRDQKMISEEIEVKNKNKAYCTIKFYILQAQSTGYHPKRLLYGIDGYKLFQKSQNKLKKRK